MVAQLGHAVSVALSLRLPFTGDPAAVGAEAKEAMAGSARSALSRMEDGDVEGAGGRAGGRAAAATAAVTMLAMRGCCTSLSPWLWGAGAVAWTGVDADAAAFLAAASLFFRMISANPPPLCNTTQYMSDRSSTIIRDIPSGWVHEVHVPWVRLLSLSLPQEPRTNRQWRRRRGHCSGTPGLQRWARRRRRSPW